MHQQRMVSTDEAERRPNTHIAKMCCALQRCKFDAPLIAAGLLTEVC